MSIVEKQQIISTNNATLSSNNTTIAENEQRVYDAGKAKGIEEGKKSEYDRFWDVIQNYGKRVYYRAAFYNWECEYIRPKHKVVARYAGSRADTFYASPIKKIEAEYFDFTNCARGSSVEGGWYRTFMYCKNLEEIEDIGITNSNAFWRTFQYCSKLKRIERIYSDENTTYNYAFNSCTSLEYLRVDGVIGKNGFNVSSCTLLSHDSLMSIINALKSGASNTVTLGADNLAKLTDAEKAIATEKGWTLL